MSAPTRRRPGALRRSPVAAPIEVPDNAQDATARRRSSRVTPRNSAVDEAVTTAAEETPFGDLRQLAGMMQKPTTPIRQSNNAGPTPQRRSVRRTPGSALPRAIRALQQRRAAALTPGNTRRRSGKVQRDTPRDTLRALSRVLAPASLPVEPSPLPELASRGPAVEDDDLDADADLPAPRLSMPIDDDDEDDSFQMPPPRLSVPLDDDLTQRSVEQPRRAITQSRLSRGSPGDIRTSDRFADLEELAREGFADDGRDEDTIRPDLDDYEDLDVGGDGMEFEEGLTARDLLEQESGRQSDIRAAILEGDDENSFVFTMPPPRHITSSPDPPARIEPSPNPPRRIASSPEAPRDSASPSPGLEDVEEVEPSSPVDRRAPSAPKEKKVQLSQYGIPVPPLPSGLVKKMAATFARTAGGGKSKIGKDTLAAVMQATDWFFEQLSDDLAAFSKHAGRKTIDESDMITLMKRQRQINTNTTPFSLAQRHLPRELLQDIRMAPPSKVRKRSNRRQLDTVEEEDESV
ncbi:MAG: hypothetical protein M1817_001403 [Caeruleum heppii]|nr:MAG: hypothetical protein M1817_001403 [Caeruleum heppii]